MGVYHKAVCEALREYIDPGYVEGSGRKQHEITLGPAANVVVHAMMTRWRGKFVRFVADTHGGDESRLYESVSYAEDGAELPWIDVTAEVIADMNRRD